MTNQYQTLPNFNQLALCQFSKQNKILKSVSDKFELIFLNPVDGNIITQLTLCYILQTFCPQWPIPLLIRPCNQDRWSHSSVQPLAIPHQELRGPWMAIPCRKMIGKQLFENIAPFKTKFCKQKRTKVNSLSPKKWTFWSIKI